MRLLNELRQQGFEVMLVGERIGVRPADKLSPELARQIKEHKPALIEALRKQKQADQYSRSKYPPKPQDRCPACKERSWWLSKHGLWVCRVCHPPAPGAEVEPTEYQCVGQTQKIDSRGSEGAKRRWCEGYKPPRWVRPAVCSWHIQQADLACAECKHLTKAEREFFMDNYLNKAIAELNARGCRYYPPGDPQGQCQRICDLEKRITEAFLIGDVKNFIEAVDSWQQCFRGATKCLSK